MTKGLNRNVKIKKINLNSAGKAFANDNVKNILFV
jgi:hypothetical protein